MTSVRTALKAVAAAAAAGATTQTDAGNTSSTSSPCGQIAFQINNRSPNSSAAVDPFLAQACMQSVPFNQTDAADFLKWWDYEYISFQSNLAYLKDPPTSYQQPAADVRAMYKQVLGKTNNNSYTNQLDFQQDVSQIVHATHDGHFSISLAFSSAFVFSAPYVLASVSSNGTALPKVYNFHDLDDANAGRTNNTPSALATINGEDAVSFLENWASKFSTSGSLESHGDWNFLFGNAARDYASAGGGNAVFRRAIQTTLPTDLWFNVTFENGTTIDKAVSATVLQPALWANITDGQDVYDTFVALSDNDDDDTSAGSSKRSGLPDILSKRQSTVGQTPSGWQTPAYPKPFVVQKGLGGSGEGAYTTGYMFPKQSLAVLSVPSFEMSGNNATSFSDVITLFINQTKSAGIKYIVFDVQGNPGGTAVESTEIFKHFFPQMDPFGGSRQLSHPTGDSLASFYSSISLDSEATGNMTENETISQALPLAAPLFLSAATGKKWKSWEEVASGIYQDKGASFTPTQRQDFSSSWYDEQASVFSSGIFGFANRSTNAQQPFPAENMLILADGFCSSTCTVMMELFHQQAGVRTVAVGGQPKTGPMQASGGVRGALAGEALATDAIDLAFSVNPGKASQLFQQLSPGIQLTGTASFNFRDQIRPNDTFPLQFAYIPAGCRLFYTQQNFNNFTQLWIDAANAVFHNNGTTCVEGSTGQKQQGPKDAAAGNNGTLTESSGSPSGSPNPSSSSSSAISKAGAASLKVNAATAVASLLVTVVAALVTL